MGAVNWLFECPSVLSRAQIETQATNTHVKLSGSIAAISLLNERHVINIVKIIPVKVPLRHSRVPEL